MSYRNSLLLAIAMIVTLVCADAAFAQGRGGGGGRPSGAGGGRPTTAGPPAGMGVDRGLGTASTRSNGRSDTGLGNASTRSNGRSDTGLDRARQGGRATMPDNNELHRYTGISKKLGTTPEDLRAQFETALAANPDLKWGQFVAANVIADNLSARHPGITSAAILTGLQNGDSIGETLENLGLGEEQAEQAEKAAKREIKESRKNQ